MRVKPKDEINERPFCCFKCGKENLNLNNQKRHVLSHFYKDFTARLPLSPPFSCIKCDFNARKLSDLARHVAFQHEVSYKCNVKQTP